MNAVGYCRISTAEQSNYSLDYQRKQITDYCHRHDLTLVSIFTDDGESSYTFDRPDYRALEQFIKKHRNIHYLIVLDHDRFSRNLAEALIKIKELNDKFKVKVLATTDSFDMDYSDPSNFLIRSFKYMMAESELHRIRQRVRNGQQQAAMSGRFLAKAPFGYSNAKDDTNKSILLIDEEKAKVVRWMFKEFVRQPDIEPLRAKLAEKGHKFTGRSTLQKMLCNHVYAGLIKVPGKKMTMVKGLHAPLISPDLFWTAYYKLSGKKKGPGTQNNDATPLRGVLQCWCGRSVTSGNSRGRHGKYYWYYLCPQHRKNLNAIKLHNQFNEILEHLSFDADDLELLREKVITRIAKHLQNNGGDVATLKKELKAVQTRIDNAEEKYLLQPDITQNTYVRVTKDLKEKAIHLQREIVTMETDQQVYLDRLNTMLPKLSNLKAAFEELTTDRKKQFIQILFNGVLYYRNDAYRTPFPSELINDKILELKEKGLLFIEQPFIEIGGKSPEWS